MDSATLSGLIHQCQAFSLLGQDSQQFADLIQQRYRELEQCRVADRPLQVILAERDALTFLASFLAASHFPCHLFLTNPGWVAAEWQQVFSLVVPDLFWGNPPFGHQCVRDASSPDPCRPWDAPAILIPTGGSSGKIRFAAHTWDSLMASVQGFRQYFQVERVNSCCVLPLYHVSGLMQFLRSFVSGGQLLIQASKALEMDGWCEIEPEAFFLSLVPTQLQRLLAHPGRTRWLGRFQTVLLGGAPAWPALLEAARSARIALAPTYGMTETASQVATLKPAAFLQGVSGCGTVLPHAQITVRSPTGEVLEPGQIGQITIEADSLMVGYYPLLAAPIADYQPDDLGFFDASGSLHIVGRSSDKIITGGEKVFPAEVEAAIRATPWVEDVCVLGLPDPHWGEVVAAAYIPRHQALSPEQWRVILSHQLSKPKHPKRWFVLPTLPRNAQGKVDRLRLRQLLGV